MSDPSALRACLRDVPLIGHYEPDDHPRDTFLLPLLARAVRYDRAAGYFSSSSLAVAADGLEPFIERGGLIRLVVNHQLSDEDVDAVERGLGLREAVQGRIKKASVAALIADGAPARLRLLCTLVALGQLDIKVAVAADEHGVPLRAEVSGRIHHAKFGVFTDRCEPPCRVAFEGSNNESMSGWLANYETYNAFESWEPVVWDRYGSDIDANFNRHWDGKPPTGWQVVELPDAARDGLLAAADTDLVRMALKAQGRDTEVDAVIGRILAARGEADQTDPMSEIRELLDAPARVPGVGLGTTVVDPWPHQSDVGRKVASGWPCSRMFSDEVGLGKTIEVGLVLRELLVSRRVRRVLMLVPASVLWQWQGELWEKFTLAVPVLDGKRLVWPEGSRPDSEREEQVIGSRWDAADVMLASSHLARRRQERMHLVDRQWDLVVVDEAHHARRRGSKATKDDPNALLRLLRDMRRSGSWQGVVLATATPMQMHPHEAYDLLDVLGLPGPHPEHPGEESWRDTGAVGFNRYYEQLAKDDPAKRDWRHLRALARSHHAEYPGDNPHLRAAIEAQVADGHMSRSAAKKIARFDEAISDKAYRGFDGTELAWLDAWLREHTPMRALVHRSTRHLLRAYQARGVIAADVVIPVRKVRDLRVDFDEAEQALYDRIETWIRTRYAQAAQAAAQGDRKAQATGFILTVYRRRLTSSFKAIELSLRRRRELLSERGDGLVNLAALLDEDDRRAIDDVPDDLEALLDSGGDDDPSLLVAAAADAAAAEVEELDSFLAALDARPAYDAKLLALVDDLRAELGGSKPDGSERQAIVFTQFTDTMDALRGQLARLWPGKVGCYSGRGRGGEVHVPGSTAGDPGAWVATDKTDVKARFKDGELRLLVGTDAMSEGLNLQMCELLYNLDLPWNFMRVEQRIGRVDRIGGHPTVHVVNLLVTGTVEERIYSGIRDDFADFESIVGAAQPVLAQTEEAIRRAALAVGPDRDALLAREAQALIDSAQDAQAAAVNLDTFEQDVNAWRPAAALEGETASGADWLDRLRSVLTTHPLLGQRFEPLGGDLWRYEDERGSEWIVTFDRKVAESTAENVALFVWGHPAFPTAPRTPVAP